MADLLGTEGLPGPSWEGFCIEAVAALIGDRAEVFFYRNEDGDEIDLVIEFSNSKTWVVEIKFNPDAKIRPGFWRACKAIGPAERFVVHKGDAAFTNRDGLQALPLLDFLSLVGTIV
jgi:predicted AAA+ superfamily ATPase